MTARSEPNRFVLRSDLTFHGVARRIPVEVTATLDAERVLHVDGEFTLDVRAFALIPPRVLGMQVYPELKVRLRMALQPQL